MFKARKYDVKKETKLNPVSLWRYEVKYNTDVEKELLDRIRRIETKLTRYLATQGFDTQSRKPEWKNGTVDIPSPDCSLKQILAAIPQNHEGAISVTVDGNWLCEFEDWTEEYCAEDK